MAAILLGGLAVALSADARPNACKVPELGLALAGPGVVDCGIGEHGDAHARVHIVACARKALAAGKPVRFGIAVDRYDEGVCDVMVADARRRYWLISMHWRIGILAEEPTTVFVGRCPTIDLDWVDPEGDGLFGPRECAFDADAVERAKIRAP